jgi:hypothetical protein
MMRIVVSDQVGKSIRTWEGLVEDALQPEQLIQRLADLAKRSPESRQAILAGLSDANLASDDGAWAKEAEFPLRAALQVEPDVAIDPARVLDVMSQLLEYLSDWDRVVWSTWKQIAPESRVRRPPRLQQSIKAYFTNDASVSRHQVMRDIGTLKQLISSLVSAMGVAGNTFATGCLKELSPQQIEEFVRGGEEKMPLLGDRFKTTCWNKYVQLSAAMEEKAPDVINAAVVGFVEKFLKGALQPAAGAPEASEVS